MATFTANSTTTTTRNGFFAVTNSPLTRMLSLLLIGFITACNPAKETIAPQATATPAVTEAPAAANVRVSADAIDVRAFGAKGDGLTDDTDAIRRALKNSTGKQVVFQTGIYKISQIIKLEASNVELIGQGVAKLQSTERTIIDLGTVTNVAFTNLTFESTSRDASTYYYGLLSANKKTVDGLTITGCTFTAPYCSTSGVKIVTDAVGSSIENVHVSNCTFTDLGNMGIEIQNHLNDGVNRFSQIDIRNSTFRNLGLNENAAYHHGMAVSCSGKGNNVIIAANTIINPYDLGIELAGSVKNAQLLRNEFSGLTRTNKEANRPVAIIAISSAKSDLHENVKIIGNQNTGTTDNAYVFFGNMASATIEDNTFNTQWYVQIRNVSNSRFKNNQIASRGTCALSIESTDLTTQDNTFTNTTLACVGSTAAEAVVKFTGAKTVRNVISNSQLTRRAAASKFFTEANAATGNALKDCTYNN